MSGGLMQLVAYGAQDIYLTGNPMITYFKIVYRRHTNFAMESIQQVFNGSAGFDQKVSALLSRTGDLISGIYLEATLPAISGVDGQAERWTENVGHHLIKTVEIEIGGQLIDRHYGDWLDIWAQLTVPAEQHVGYYEMIGQDPSDALGIPGTLQKDTHSGSTNSSVTGRKIYIPLQFWFCRNVGLALPLIALQYHEVKINLAFAKSADLLRGTTATTDPGALSNVELWVDYIYLDTDERRRFAQVSHEYLIEQLQTTGDISAIGGTSRSSPTTINISLDFNHPVKELIWVAQSVTLTTGNDRQPSNYTAVKAPPPRTVGAANEMPGGYSTLAAVNTADELTLLTEQSCVVPPGGLNPVLNAELKLNGHVRFAERPGTYFNWVQCMDHHTNVPDSQGINVYSFALKPEAHQPSGTCNFSRIDNAQLSLKLAFLSAAGAEEANYPGVSPNNQLLSTTCNVRVYAVNYNVLRIMSGMGGLAYSN